MPTPKAGYVTEAGLRVPGTTTIISRFKESGGLIHWAWDLGRQGIDYREARDSAATAGTICHSMIECAILGKPRPAFGDFAPELVALAERGFDAYERWARSSKVEVTETEVQLVSEEYCYGGTLDGVGMLDGVPVLIDWKTSNRLYADYLIQLAAYWNLWREVRGQDLREFHLLRVGKDDASFHHHSWHRDSLHIAWSAFKHMRALYDIDKQLKKMVG